MLECKSLRISYPDKIICTDFNYKICTGDLIWLQGKNGSGKTTFLKSISGIMRPELGYILYEDINIQQNLELYFQNICFLMHQNAIKDNITVLDNLLYWANLYNNHELLNIAISYFSLNYYLNVDCTKLSQGFQKRVALARLMISNKKIWILDEPYTNLDIETKHILNNLIATKCDNNGIVILTCHDNKLDLENYKIINIEDYQN